MNVTIAKGTAFGRISAPPSKSMAHRMLICGALSNNSNISGISFSEDIKATINCLKSLGANVEINGGNVNIGGISIQNPIVSDELFCNESGSTLRFLIPVCLLFNQKLSLSGTERLMQRSLSVYADICKSQNLSFEQSTTCVTLKGRLSEGNYSVRGDVSSQFISGLMFALPLLENDSIIDITGAVESAPYLGMTVKVLGDFGIRITRTDEHTIFIKGGQVYKNRNLKVEGDYSNAAFFEALNTLGGNVAISGLEKSSVQGDAVYKKYFIDLLKGSPEIDISDCPDLAPVLMAVAAANNGVILTGTHRLKIKESDRSQSMAYELKKFGCKTKVLDNSITVYKSNLSTPSEPLFSHNDHRIVMALSILCTLTGGTINGAQAISKSFPDFFNKLSSLGINIEEDML